MRDGRLESNIDYNSQEDNCAGYYKLLPPRIIKCNLCDNFKVHILPRGRSDMMKHMEETHNLPFQESMRKTALLPAMEVVDLDVL